MISIFEKSDLHSQSCSKLKSLVEIVLIYFDDFLRLKAKEMTFYFANKFHYLFVLLRSVTRMSPHMQQY
jgi:hypothetical protein